jgi:hypothetical protein
MMSCFEQTAARRPEPSWVQPLPRVQMCVKKTRGKPRLSEVVAARLAPGKGCCGRLKNTDLHLFGPLVLVRGGLRLKDQCLCYH